MFISELRSLHHFWLSLEFFFRNKSFIFFDVAHTARGSDEQVNCERVIGIDVLLLELEFQCRCNMKGI